MRGKAERSEPGWSLAAEKGEPLPGLRGVLSVTETAVVP